MHFFTFTPVRQTCFACNFFLVHFLQLFQRIRNQREILRFLISFSIKKKFLGHIGTFCKLWSQMHKKRLKISKNVFCKCVLDFNFAPITGSVFFIFKKSLIRCTLVVTLNSISSPSQQWNSGNLNICRYSQSHNCSVRATEQGTSPLLLLLRSDR